MVASSALFLVLSSLTGWSFAACTVGFSGVLFALKMVLNAENPGDTVVYGFRVPTRHAACFELKLLVHEFGHETASERAVRCLRESLAQLASDAAVSLLGGTATLAATRFVEPREGGHDDSPCGALRVEFALVLDGGRAGHRALRDRLWESLVDAISRPPMPRVVESARPVSDLGGPADELSGAALQPGGASSARHRAFGAGARSGAGPADAATLARAESRRRASAHEQERLRQDKSERAARELLRRSADEARAHHAAEEHARIADFDREAGGDELAEDSCALDDDVRRQLRHARAQERSHARFTSESDKLAAAEEDLRDEYARARRRARARGPRGRRRGRALLLLLRYGRDGARSVAKVQQIFERARRKSLAEMTAEERDVLLWESAVHIQRIFRAKQARRIVRGAPAWRGTQRKLTAHSSCIPQKGPGDASGPQGRERSSVLGSARRGRSALATGFAAVVRTAARRDAATESHHGRKRCRAPNDPFARRRACGSHGARAARSRAAHRPGHPARRGRRRIPERVRARREEPGCRRSLAAPTARRTRYWMRRSGSRRQIARVALRTRCGDGGAIVERQCHRAPRKHVVDAGAAATDLVF